MNSKQLEGLIEKLGCTAPRVTAAMLEDKIAEEFYFTAADGVFGSQGTPVFAYEKGPRLRTLTFCVLVLDNGHTVIGTSACVSIENFNEEIGRKIARDKAINKLWELEGYALSVRLHELGKDEQTTTEPRDVE